ncbi:amidophosphoribosyltransferase [uncultured Porphyromonas sp.]|uniref:amidophosphoribosyltransferase n=1 Tax=uncultured Porphyromonas sp. TaxID=159274 RepID=UPI00260F6892|nr:amidophosphoribosyltransferase [uncultured Porphyromonas sp.]
MEELKHECGIAMVRLRKPLTYYQEKYGTWRYGLNKMYLLMEKQHNRGQDGAGIACVKLTAPTGEEYMYRDRALGNTAITEIFASVERQIQSFSKEKQVDPNFAQAHIPYAAECYMGHLRYATQGKQELQYVHPMLRRSNWRAKSLSLCGNFTLTSVDRIFDSIASVGQHPRSNSDTHILLEQLGHRLDREVEHKFRESKAKGLTGMDITHDIESRIDTTIPLKECAPLWDGGYTMCGLTGSGEMFMLRDPWGIRPAFYYFDDEIVVCASERAVIQTVLNVSADSVHELERGNALTINKTGSQIKVSNILSPNENKACSFERIYFSRGSDRDIYKERKKLGEQLIPDVLKAIDNDIDHSVFSFIPNTAETCYFGMIEGMERHFNHWKAEKILDNPQMSKDEIYALLDKRVRSEKVVIKDIKLRTFISEGASRTDLAQHVYDITYGTVEKGVDNLVVIDDSVVRGTTLKESIIRILDRLHPKKIVVVSSAPQIRYPDHYGIDMSRMREFVAFLAAIDLLLERGMAYIIHDTYRAIIESIHSPLIEERNFVKDIYAPFTVEEINKKIVERLRPSDISAEVELVFQSLEGLQKEIPNHTGDWYFSGDYPTPGGVKLTNMAYKAFYEEDFRKQ